jgi:hypothetical protein
MSGYEHIHPDFRHIMSLSDKERVEFMDQPRWIGHKSAQQILDTLQGLMHKPERPRMPNLLIVGDSNNGKTTVVRRFRDLCGQSYVNEDAEPVKPIILAEAPPSADEKGLYISILEQFFTPYRASDSVSKLRYQVIHLFRACHVRMLIIDEFHSLLTGSAIKQREVMNAIKLLCNELVIPIVGVGTREAVRVLHTDPQHASRFDVMSLPLWELNQDFQRLLAGFEKILPLKKPSKLHQPELATLLLMISEGNTGNLHRLLIECATEAIKNGKEQIDKAIIESKAWMRPTRGIRELVG